MRVIVMLILQNVGVNDLVNGVNGDMKSARLFRKSSHSPSQHSTLLAKSTF